jgi:hypothetical protein
MLSLRFELRIATLLVWRLTNLAIRAFCDSKNSKLYLGAKRCRAFVCLYILGMNLKLNRSASGLVVKFNVAIVEPPVRFRACASIRDSLVARISACHAGDPGSIPGLGVNFCCWFDCSFYSGQLFFLHKSSGQVKPKNYHKVNCS